MDLDNSARPTGPSRLKGAASNAEFDNAGPDGVRVSAGPTLELGPRLPSHISAIDFEQRAKVPIPPEVRETYAMNRRIYKNKSAAKVSNALVLAAGLLTTSTYPALFAPYVSAEDSTSSGSKQVQDPFFNGNYGPYQVFRLLNAISFVASMVCILGSIAVLVQVHKLGRSSHCIFKL